MAGLIRKSLDQPEETRVFEDGMGNARTGELDGGAVGRATFQPGWQWSKHVKPIAGTDSCQARTLGYFVSGRMKVVMDDGEEMEFGPGDFAEWRQAMTPGSSATNPASSSTGRASPITPDVDPAPVLAGFRRLRQTLILPRC